MAPTVLLEHNDLPEVMTKLKQDMSETASKRERYGLSKCQHSPLVQHAPDHMVIAF